LKGLVSDLGLHHDQASLYRDSLGTTCLNKMKFTMRGQNTLMWDTILWELRRGSR